MPDRGELAVPVAPSSMCCSCSSRCPHEVNIWPRGSTSRTGRRTCCAASAASVTCGQTIALQPNAPPTNCVSDPDLGQRQAEQRGHGQLDGLDALARVIERQLVAVPDRRGGQRLDRVVVVGREPERRVDADVGGGEPVLDVPALQPRRA